MDSDDFHSDSDADSPSDSTDVYDEYDEYDRVDPTGPIPEGNDDFFEKIKGTDREMSDYDGFVDAECPECGMVRPFVGNCPRCNWEAPDAKSSMDASDWQSNDDDELSIDRLVLLVVAGESKDIATAKATAALDNRTDADPDDGYDLVETFDDPASLFPGKWGALDDAIPAGDEQGEDIKERLLPMLTDDSEFDRDQDPVVYAEDGTTIEDVDALDTALAGEMALTQPRDEATIWFVPAVLYTTSDNQESSGKPTKQLDCYECPGKTTFTYQGSAGEDNDDRVTEHIWTCTECGMGQLADPPEN
jgi:hypothetical protein